MTPVAPCIVLDDPCVTRIIHESQFSWQAQYLVTLDDISCIFQGFVRIYLVVFWLRRACALLTLKGKGCYFKSKADYD